MDNLGKYFSHRHNPDLRVILELGMGDGVGDEDFRDDGIVKPLQGLGREDTVGGAGSYRCGALVDEHLGGLAQGAGGVNHIVNYDDVLAFNLSDGCD